MIRFDPKIRPPHADATLDLQRALHEAFDLGGYRQYIYEGEPEPPMDAEDAAWAEGILRGG